MQRGNAEQEVQTLVRLLRDLDATTIDLEQVLELLVAREDRLEGGQRAQIVGLDRERLLPILDGLVGLAEAVFVAARDLGRELVRE